MASDDAAACFVTGPAFDGVMVLSIGTTATGLSFIMR